MDPLPRGMPGEASGDVCPMRGGTPGRPCRCCHRGEGLLMSVRVRDQQVGLGCSCGREARVGDPTGQGSGRECGSGGQSGGALWASLQLPCGRTLWTFSLNILQLPETPSPLQAYSSLYAFNNKYQDLERTGFLLHQ